MSNIKTYLPKVLQDIRELEEICKTEDSEFGQILTRVNAIYNETIIDTATSYGVHRYEQIFNITPASDDTMQTRKFRIKNIIQTKLPYTKRWLENKLTEIVGNSTGWTLNINYDDYTVAIILSGLDTSLMGEVQRQLRNAIPANMVLEIGGEPLSSSEILMGVGVHLAFKIKIESAYTDINIFNSKDLINGTHSGGVGTIPVYNTGTTRCCLPTNINVPVKPNTTYRLDCGTIGVGIMELNTNGDDPIITKNSGWLSGINTFTTSATTTGINYNIRKLDNTNITPQEVAASGVSILLV